MKIWLRKISICLIPGPPKIKAFDYIGFGVFFVMFLVMLCFECMTLYDGITKQIAGNTESAAFYFLFGVMALPALLIFGLPAFFMGRRILKYRKYCKKNHSVFEDVPGNDEKA